MMLSPGFRAPVKRAVCLMLSDSNQQKLQRLALTFLVFSVVLIAGILLAHLTGQSIANIVSRLPH
jgi:hypothetical protein